MTAHHSEWSPPTQLFYNQWHGALEPLHGQGPDSRIDAQVSDNQQPTLTNCAPLLIPGGLEAQISSDPTRGFSAHQCSHTGCGKSFKHKGDLTRHTKTHNELPTHHCHIPLCPRSEFGKGFHRKDKLVAHLKACHKLEHGQARYLASI